MPATTITAQESPTGTGAAINRALVWGACGFIGSHLVERLLRDGRKVSVLTRKRSLYAPHWWDTKVEWYELQDDEKDSAVMDEALAQTDHAFVLTMPGSPVQPAAELQRRSERAFLAHRAFLTASRRVKPRLVLASTRQVYGVTGGDPVNELRPPAPRSAYGKTALEIERLYLASPELGASVCRLSNVYGSAPGCRQAGHGVINKMITSALHDKIISLFGAGKPMRDYIYIDDALDGLIACSAEERAANRIFNIGFGRSIRIADAAATLAKYTGAEVISVPWPDDYLQAETGDFLCDIDLARSILRFAPRFDFDAGVQATIEALSSYQLHS